MKRKNIAFVLILVFCTTFFSGCQDEKKAQTPSKTAQKPLPCCDLSKTKDGTYTAESEKDPDIRLGTGRLTLTFKDHKITEAKFIGINEDGTEKDANYGKKDGEIKNERTYKIAQNALKANADYARQFVEKQDLMKIDAIAGASISYSQFIEAAKKAIDKANKG